MLCNSSVSGGDHLLPKKGVGETADLQREIQMDLLLMISKVHLTKRKFKHETKIEKVGVLCFCLHNVFKNVQQYKINPTAPGDNH